LDGQRFDFVCLVNNASAVEPIAPIEECAADDLEAHLQIGLVAPLLLTSLFIGRFAGEKMRKKVVYISSGAAFTPLPGNSVYSTTKAGIHMLAQCVGLEQKDREDGFEVLSIGSGMVDTGMQRAIRLKTSDGFAMVDFFKQAFEEGRLQDPGNVAEKIYTIIENQYEQGKYVSISDV
jgi:benzil reductase ((S)-benzoin forming)